MSELLVEEISVRFGVAWPVIGGGELLQVALCGGELPLIQFAGGLHPQLSHRIVALQLRNRVFSASDLGAQRATQLFRSAKGLQRSTHVTRSDELVR